jgi:hypothetical protein
MTKPWDAAGWSQRTYKSARTVKPVGPLSPPKMEIIHKRRSTQCTDGTCPDCGTHVCGCKQRAETKAREQQASAAALCGRRASLTEIMGDKVTQIRCAVGTCANFMGDIGVPPLQPIDPTAGMCFCVSPSTLGHTPHCDGKRPTPGTFAWLKTLAPEAMVRRPHWTSERSETAGQVLRTAVDDCGDMRATDWQLAEEAKPAEFGSQHVNMRVRLKGNHLIEGVFAGVIGDYAPGRVSVRWDQTGHGTPLASAIELVPEPGANEAPRFTPGNLTEQERETVRQLMNVAKPAFKRGDRVRVASFGTHGIVERENVVTSNMYWVIADDVSRCYRADQLEHAPALPAARTPLDDEALVLLCLANHWAIKQTGDGGKEWHTFCRACPSYNERNRIITLMEQDDARLVQMLLEARASNSWESMNRAVFAREDIGDAEIYKRIRRLADAK